MYCEADKAAGFAVLGLPRDRLRDAVQAHDHEKHEVMKDMNQTKEQGLRSPSVAVSDIEASAV